MGSPEFAVPSLNALLEGGYDVVGVLSAPDRPAGRGKKLRASAVKEFALSKGLKVLQPTNLKSKKFLKELKALGADLQVVVAFRMLPEAVFAMPPMGTLNLHASLLPNYRGAAPINWAIMNGETKTGLTTFFIEQQIDTGEILMQEEMEISIDDTVGSLHDRMMDAGGALVYKTVLGIEKGELKASPQIETANLKEAPKIFKEDCAVDWQKNVQEVYNHIRGLSPYPTAFAMIGGHRVKLYQVEMESNGKGEPGAFETDNKTFLRVFCADGSIAIKELQLEGRKRMPIVDLLRGFNFDLDSNSDGDSNKDSHH